MTRAPWSAALLAVAAVAACHAPPAKRDPAPAKAAAATTTLRPDGSVDVAAINQPFRELKDVESWVAKFELESRDIYACRLAIVDAIALRPGERIADVGAGTGLFEPLFALAVGPAGKVVAVDIAPLFLEHIRQRALREALPNVSTVLGGDATPNLAPGSVDVLFVCDTYHHFEQPAAMLAAIRAALVPGGRLVVVDFDKIPGKSRPFVLGHVRADRAAVHAEIAAAGFTLEREPAVGLAESWMAVFRKPR